MKYFHIILFCVAIPFSGFTQEIDLNRIPTTPSSKAPAKNTAAGSDTSAASAQKAASEKLARENNMSFGGGPNSAFYSALMPGLGDRIVNKNSKVWPVVTGLYVGSIATAVFFKINSNKNYELYQNVGWDADGNYKNDLNTFYDKANNNNTNCAIMLGVAGSILLADVIYVAVKGTKNKNKYNKASTFFFPVINYNSSFNRSIQLSVIQKF